MQSEAVKRVAAIALLCTLTALAGCAASQEPPFDPHRCSLACIEMAAPCKANCMKVTDATDSRSGSRATCERTCQTQRDLCDVQCLQGRQPSF